ncbi:MULTISPECIES: penicillin acylase family protein [unclassified Massilia]|uniref:penicillin acylase family protein n=1 Tax=unclassified Massilia TaxID=2609279 RepID=UPI0017806899|nr:MULTISPECIES: penicillin acylase family protein [unclassified Massilia]MBD8531594.1 penicillin acylase family protein [Massilia sp. CFBP 13647]MBD8673610.1 penicillin acylase family protein [Massilia sp. CFBP 13721]
MILSRSVAIALAGLVIAASPALAEQKSAPANVTATARTASNATELARWQTTAARVTIMRDKWGIPHVFGKSDADAVFGMLYAQAEDDFNRVELNYINAMGRLAEVEGEKEVWRDLRMKLYITPSDMQAKYAASPAWLQELMVAFADGLNFYLHTHPEVKPKLLTRFEPWMALSFSEGSIGGDIESIELKDLEAFYGKALKPTLADTRNVKDEEPRGSNGFAIAPKLSRSGHPLLLINPHTSFYFRPEIHMASEQGLNAYGAVTWGQFFIYQGFNERAGWMHTSGGGDVIDEYLETVVERQGKFFYKYGKEERALRAVPIALPFKKPDGGMGSRSVTAYFSHHGPIVRGENGKWVAVKMMDEPVKALTQSYSRTKAKNYAAFYQAMELRTNSSNNTVYADADGNIAYFHGNFIPKRDTKFDWSKPVDGSNPATEWQGLHDVKDTITLTNPASGYISNTNNWPFSASGANSPKRKDYPDYMWSLPENARGIHAERVLKDARNLTLDSLIAAAYDSYLTAFEPLVPQLARDFDALPSGDARKAQLAEQVASLRGWDLRFAANSVPTALAVYWGQDMVAANAPRARAANMPTVDFISTRLNADERLEALSRASAKLTRDFGTWKTPWGEINRFQRISGDVDQAYDDGKPSWPVAFTSATWGSLASFGMVAKQKTKRIYGDRGNSFVAAVEFGPKVRARSILAGGQSGNPASKHFADQAEMYSRGEFKDVLFYKEDIRKQLEREYHPGK